MGTLGGNIAAAAEAIAAPPHDRGRDGTASRCRRSRRRGAPPRAAAAMPIHTIMTSFAQ